MTALRVPIIAPPPRSPSPWPWFLFLFVLSALAAGVLL